MKRISPSSRSGATDGRSGASRSDRLRLAFLHAGKDCLEAEMDYLEAVELCAEADPDLPVCPALDEARRLLAEAFVAQQERFRAAARAYTRAVRGKAGSCGAKAAA